MEAIYIMFKYATLIHLQNMHKIISFEREPEQEKL